MAQSEIAPFLDSRLDSACNRAHGFCVDSGEYIPPVHMTLQFPYLLLALQRKNKSMPD